MAELEFRTFLTRVFQIGGLLSARLEIIGRRHRRHGVSWQLGQKTGGLSLGPRPIMKGELKAWDRTGQSTASKENQQRIRKTWFKCL